MNKQNKAILNKLYALDLRKSYPTFPEFALPPRLYSDTTANGLTKCIIEFLNFTGHQAERISSMGRVIDQSKVVDDVLGRKRTIGSKKYIKGTSTNGTADISSVIYGKSVKIEVKIGKDKQSDDQKVYQSNVERAGGIYIIAKDFDMFIESYRKIITEGQTVYKSQLGRDFIVVSDTYRTIQFLDNYEVKNISQSAMDKIKL